MIKTIEDMKTEFNKKIISGGCKDEIKLEMKNSNEKIQEFSQKNQRKAFPIYRAKWKTECQVFKTR